MREDLIVNASPIIALGKIGLLRLLVAVAGGAAIPPAVVAEVLAAQDDAALVLEAVGIRCLPAVTINPVVAQWGLGLGETEVLSHAIDQPGVRVVIDDLAARRCAASFRIPVIGTLGVVLLAKRIGELPAAAPVIRQLQQVGLYVSSSLIAEALALVGEKPVP